MVAEENGAGWIECLPLIGRVLARRRIRQANEVLLEKQQMLMQRTLVLERAFLEVSDCIFLVGDGAFLRLNQAAKDWVDTGAVTAADLHVIDSERKYIELAGHPFAVRSVKTIDAHEQAATLITLRDLEAERELEERIASARSKEQAAIQAQIENGLVNKLTALRERLCTINPSSPSRRRKLEKIIELSETSIFECQSGVRTAESAPQTVDSFREALERLIRDFEDNFRFPVLLSWEGNPITNTETAWNELFLIVQEALRNAWRHAGASAATVTLSPHSLEILDDGTGLHPDCERSGGIGLRSIYERSQRIGFTAEIASPPQNGWIFNRS